MTLFLGVIGMPRKKVGTPVANVPLVDAAQKLRLTYQQAYNAVLAGHLAAHRINGRWFVTPAAIAEYSSAKHRA